MPLPCPRLARLPGRGAAALLLLLVVAAPLAGQEGLEAPEAPVEAAPLGAEAAMEVVADETDAELAARLERIFANLAALQGVEVAAGGGVVRLAGEVPSPAAQEQALAIVRRQEGVVAVDDRLRVEPGLAGRLAPVWERLRERAYDLLTLLPLLVVALVLLALAWSVSRWVGRHDRLFRRLSANRFVQDLLGQVVASAVFLAGLLLALEVMGATALVGAVLGTAGLVGLAVGFAFRDMAENYIASVLLSVRQPFAPGDHVTVGEHEGKVIRLTSRATILMTLDGNHLRIPNAEVFKSVILNFTRNPERRFAVRVGLGTGEDAAAARRVGEVALGEVPGVLAEPAPSSAVEGLGASSLDLVFYGWVDQRSADFLKVRSLAVVAVKEALEGAGHDLPEPIHRVWLERRGREAREPRGQAPAPRPATEDAAAVAPDRHLERTIEAERAATRDEDLLDPQAQQE